MRVVKEINREDCRVTIFHWNGKYLIKLEQDSLEQTFKIDEFDVYGPDQVADLLTDQFMESAVERFKSMHNDLSRVLQEI